MLRTLVFVFCATWLLVPQTFGQGFDRLTRPMVTLTDPEVMENILTDLLILPPDDLTSIFMVDITANGYGADDLLILNPSAQTYLVGEFTPPSIRELISGWDLDADYRFESIWAASAPALMMAHENEDAPAAIAASCIDAVEQHYEGNEIDLMLSRGDGTVRLEMWKYEPENMSYGGPGEALACELKRQQFRMATPVEVIRFKEEGECVETWVDNGVTKERKCPPE